MERSAVRLLLLAVIVAGCGGSSSQDETVEVGEQTEDTTWADTISLVPRNDTVSSVNDGPPPVAPPDSPLAGDGVRIPMDDGDPLDSDDSPPGENCDPNYRPCVPIDDDDVDCAGGPGDGPSYVSGPVRVVGRDIYRLDYDRDGIGCDP